MMKNQKPATQNARQKPTKAARLNYQQHRTAYPWAHTASHNAMKKTNLAHEVEYLRHPNIHNILTD